MGQEEGSQSKVAVDASNGTDASFSTTVRGAPLEEFFILVEGYTGMQRGKRIEKAEWPKFMLVTFFCLLGPFLLCVSSA